MSARPARSAKKITSYFKVVDEGPVEEVRKSRRRKAKHSDSSDNGSDYKGDDDDKESDGYNDDTGARVSEAEDEDMTSNSTRKPRRRKAMQSFTVSLDQMNELLTEQNESSPTLSAVRSNDGSGRALSITPAKPQHRFAPITTTQRKPRESSKNVPKPKRGQLLNLNHCPQHWRFSFEAPTCEDVAQVCMKEEFLKQTVYPNIGPSIKDFRVLREPTDLDEYLPLLATTKVHARETQFDMNTMAAHYVKAAQGTGNKDYYLLNTGFSVWALDWCPLPSYGGEEANENKSYVAIGGFPDTAENCIARDQLYPLGKQDAHPNLIQLWSMNCNTDDDGALQGEPSVYLALCILHSYGAVLDLKWCPSGGFMQAESASGHLTRLGILAATFSDGSIRIFSVPDPESLRHHLKVATANGSLPETLYIEYFKPYVTIRLGDVNFMSISWGTSERLAASATNGTVAIWDMKSMLVQSIEDLASKDSEYLDPIYLLQVHDVCVRCVDWLRSSDPAVVPWIIVTSGYDGHVRYTDLRDPYARIDIKTILGAPMSSICVPWAEGTVYVDIDFGAKMDQLYVESRGLRLFNVKGTIWDFSYSDYQPYLAVAVSDGRVKISNPAFKARRGFGMVQNCVYQLQEADVGDESNTAIQNNCDSIDDEAHQIQESPQVERERSFFYKEDEEKEFISKSDGLLGFYGANIAIQRVQWSRCLHSATWLASGSAGGLVRIDNTMMRKEQSGTRKNVGNKRLGSSTQPVKAGKQKKELK